MPAYYRVKTKRRRLKKGRLLFLLAVSAFILLLFFTARFLGSLQELQDRSDWAKSLPRAGRGKPQHFLLYTLNEEQVTTMYLFSLHPDRQAVHAVHIPPETLLNSSSEKETLVETAYQLDGREFLVTSAADLLQTDIHAFVEIKEDQLPEVTAALKLTTAETKTLDVLDYIYDAELSAPQQTERRRQVLTALADHIIQGNFLQEILRLRHVSPLVRSSLTWRNLLKLSKSFAKAKFSETVKIYSLPGSVAVSTGGNYWHVDAESVPALIEWLDSASPQMPREQITVEVLNGCGITGLANQVAQILRQEGFTVTRVTNADNFAYERSQVICRTNDMEPAKEVAVLIPNAQLIKEEVSDAEVLVTVIVGKNYKSSE
ncbi:MAG: LCP family protein [Dethiobacteraceae bacterium]|nr:LytR C-terminal domain-containing protein [Bacillota bacterium]